MSSVGSDRRTRSQTHFITAVSSSKKSVTSSSRRFPRALITLLTDCKSLMMGGHTGKQMLALTSRSFNDSRRPRQRPGCPFVIWWIYALNPLSIEYRPLTKRVQTSLNSSIEKQSEISWGDTRCFCSSVIGAEFGMFKATLSAEPNDVNKTR